MEKEFKRPRVAIIHFQLKEGGGSEARPLWLAVALKDSCDITLMTSGQVDLHKLNIAYGACLKPEDLTLVTISIPPLFRRRFDALRGFRLERYCRAHAVEFDAMVSTYNVMDFGRKGIQFIADFSFDDTLRKRFDNSPRGTRSFLYGGSALRRLYLKLGSVLSGRTAAGWKSNLTVANSEWTKKVLFDTYGIESQVIYPPVSGDFPNVPWENREDGFIFLGRISPEKRVDQVISILGKVRAQGHEIHLHICGCGNDSAYGRRIKELAGRNDAWVFLEGLVAGNEKKKLIAHHKYGISGRRNEPFGIAVAEMVKAGCLVWVPDGGGQVEIVDAQRLVYQNEEEAVLKIVNLLKSESIKHELRDQLKTHVHKFSQERFMKDASVAIFEFLGRSMKHS